MHLRLLNGACMYTGDLVHNAALDISIHARSYRAHQLFEEAITYVISQVLPMSTSDDSIDAL